MSPDGPIPVTDAAAASLTDVLRKRSSCRAFRPEPLSETTIREMLALAQSAPSWCNTQPWYVSVTAGAATERLRNLLMLAAKSADPRPDLEHPRAYTATQLGRRRESGYALYSALGISREDSTARRDQLLENFSFFGAPHVAIISTDESLGPYGVLDVGVYLASLLVAGQALGVASVPQAALAMYPDVIRDFFDLPEGRVVVVGVSFGISDRDNAANSFRTARAPMEQVVEFHFQ